MGERERRRLLIDSLVSTRAIRTEAVRDAMLAVSRAAFAPAIAVAAAYEDRPIRLKTDGAGRAVSTISQPTLVAAMLEELQVESGSHVLEIGTASGYNAALLGHLVGPTGTVVTVEIDPDLAREARHRLASAGVVNVNVVNDDGHAGHAGRAPYDRVVVTAGAAGVEPAWVEQLADGGRLVVPLTKEGGVGECVTFTKDGDDLRPTHSMPCGFVPMRRSM